MDLYKQQQFSFFLQTATERFAARLEERFRGPEQALTAIKQGDDGGDEIWLQPFTDAVFEDFLLNNVEGACFVLQALAKRSAEAVESGNVESILISMAKQLFSELMLQKTIEMLEQHAGYQSV